MFLVLLIDQALKIWVKTNLHYYEGFDMLGLSWAKIHFIENDGMAFGITFGNKCLGITNDDGTCRGIMLTPTAGKLILSTFRIIMVSFLIYFIRGLYKAGESFGLLVCLSLILAGAIGNILDSAFYGLIFSESYHNGGLAQLFPEGGGYASFLHGKVVDMFYFPMIDTRFPEWFPIWGGNRFQFFRPIFNVADASISIGVASILLFHRSFLKQEKKKNGAEQSIISSPQEE
ncbi:MAG: signal peptidase II [Saprospiraceae bacterium]